MSRKQTDENACLDRTLAHGGYFSGLLSCSVKEIDGVYVFESVANHCIYLLKRGLFVYSQRDELCRWNCKPSVKDYFYFQVGKNIRLVLPADLMVGTIALNMAQVCPIPGVPYPVLGAIDYEKELIWAIDLAVYLSDIFGLAPDPELRKNPLMEENLTLVAIASQPPNSQKQTALPPVAWVVSEVYGVVSLNPAKFRPLPTKFKSLLDNYFIGLTEVIGDPSSQNRDTVAILNVNRLFAALDSQRYKLIAT